MSVRRPRADKVRWEKLQLRVKLTVANAQGKGRMNKMARTFSQRIVSLAFGFATILILAAGHQVQAQTLVDPNSRVSAVPGFAGTGLQGYYYNNSMNDGSFDSSVINATGPLSNFSPLATFLSTNVCYPDCSGGSIYDYGHGDGALRFFLNGNASNIQFVDPMMAEPQDWSSSALILNGYIAINQPGSYLFNLGSDDGSKLTIGDYSGGSVDLTFTAAGLYQIAVNFYEDGGFSNLSLTATSDGNGGACFLGCSDGNGVLQANNLFYSQGQLEGAPAPTIGSGMSSLALLGLLGVGAVSRRHRRAKAT
jgi:hypothetical protein